MVNMIKCVYYQWKEDFKEINWYKQNDANNYLSDSSKLQMLINYILEIEDKDSEAEVVVVND